MPTQLVIAVDDDANSAVDEAIAELTDVEDTLDDNDYQEAYDKIVSAQETLREVLSYLERKLP